MHDRLADGCPIRLLTLIEPREARQDRLGLSTYGFEAYNGLGGGIFFGVDPCTGQPYLWIKLGAGKGGSFSFNPDGAGPSFTQYNGGQDPNRETWFADNFFAQADAGATVAGLNIGDIAAEYDRGFTVGNNSANGAMAVQGFSGGAVTLSGVIPNLANELLHGQTPSETDFSTDARDYASAFKAGLNAAAGASMVFESSSLFRRPPDPCSCNR